jgi:O-antigen ligase
MFDAFMGAHIAGAGWWGWQAYIDPKRVSGRLINIGSSDTLNDNLAAAHLLTVLPILCVYALTAKDKRLRLLALVTAPFIVNTFILCNSRGATVGLAVGMAVAMLLARKGHRLRMLAAAAMVGVMFVALADQTFIDRQKTINDEDAGAERIATWQGAARLLKDHPLGVGGGGFEYLSPVYIAEIVEAHDGERRSVHNTWLLLATEWGIQGFVLFCGFIGATILMLHRIRRLARDHQDLYYRSLAVQVGLVSTLTAATFSNRFLGESIYWLCGLSFALYRISVKELGTVPATQSETANATFRPAAAAAS